MLCLSHRGMNSQQFLTHAAREPLAPVYLFWGAEGYARGRCRRAVLSAALPEAEQESGLTRFDLEETALDAVLDDARSLSLFASQRLLYVTGAEAALPRGRSGEEDSGASSAAALEDYLQNPTPGTVIVLESSRYHLDGEDKAKAERVRKFYSAVPHIVEFPRFAPQEARRLAQELLREAGVSLDNDGLELLVESTGSDAARLAVEVEKLALFAVGRERITIEDLERLLPNARSSTIFQLVAALGSGNKSGSLKALDILDQLLRDGEYLPLALSFLGTQFRLALMAKQAGLRSAQQVQSHCQQLGIPMWRARAEQVAQTAGSFSVKQLRSGLRTAYQADKALRDARPDDRIVLERFTLGLTR